MELKIFFVFKHTKQYSTWLNSAQSFQANMKVHVTQQFYNFYSE